MASATRNPSHHPPPNSPPHIISGPLLPLISSTPAALLRPLQFFVAWQGVLTIAYSGVPPSVCQLKNQIDTEISGIIKENPGSLWPKTSLACLKDNKYLSMNQLIQLQQICREESKTLLESSPVTVDSLSVVVYENCCLEKTLIATKVALHVPLDDSEPSTVQVAYVEEVLRAFATENLEDYYVFMLKDGNRSAHYRNSKAGVSLVHFLSDVPLGLIRFKERVEAAMPGLYDWFSEESLHVTIRALL